MRLGILHFGEIPAGSNAVSVIHDTLESVQHCEQLGFERYWLAEHFDDNIAWRKSDIVLSLMAACTERIHVGSAGVCLPISNLTHTAFNYKTLANLFPGRIDLGLAKGFALAEIGRLTNEGDTMEANKSLHLERCTAMLQYLQDQHPLMFTPPFHGETPAIWMLGSSLSSKTFVIENKTCFSLSIFHKNYTPTLAQQFSDFQKEYADIHGENPVCNLALTIMPEGETSTLTQGVDTNIKGNAAQVCEQLQQTAFDFNASEIVVLPLCSGPQARQELIENIATLIPNHAYAKF